MNKPKKRKYYVICTGVCGNPWGRAVAGPWTKKECKGFLTRTSWIQIDKMEVVKVVDL